MFRSRKRKKLPVDFTVLLRDSPKETRDIVSSRDLRLSRNKPTENKVSSGSGT